MDEDFSLELAQDVASMLDAHAEMKTNLQDAILTNTPVAVELIPGLIQMLDGYIDTIKSLYEFWALVGDRIQEEDTNGKN